jgi:hypothetical protein
MAKTARFAGLVGGCFGWRVGCAGLRRQARKKAKGAGTEIDFQMASRWLEARKAQPDWTSAGSSRFRCLRSHSDNQ